MSGDCLEGFSKEGVRRVPVGFLAGVGKVSGSCLEVTWKVSGKYLYHSVSSENFGMFCWLSFHRLIFCQTPHLTLESYTQIELNGVGILKVSERYHYLKFFTPQNHSQLTQGHLAHTEIPQSQGYFNSPYDPPMVLYGAMVPFGLQ